MVHISQMDPHGARVDSVEQAVQVRLSLQSTVPLARKLGFCQYSNVFYFGRIPGETDLGNNKLSRIERTTYVSVPILS